MKKVGTKPIHVPDAIHLRIKQAALDSGTSMAQWLVKLVKEKLDKKEPLEY